MNKKVLKLFGALSALALASVAGCGGDDIFGTTCPPAGGYKLDKGDYNTTMVTISDDTCQVTAAQLMMTRSVNHDTTGGQCKTIITRGSNEVGSGMLSNNAGAFTYTATENDGVCVFDLTVTSTVTVTADNTFTLLANYSYGNYRSAQGMSCTDTPCSTTFTALMKK